MQWTVVQGSDKKTRQQSKQNKNQLPGGAVPCWGSLHCCSRATFAPLTKGHCRREMEEQWSSWSVLVWPWTKVYQSTPWTQTSDHILGNTSKNCTLHFYCKLALTCCMKTSVPGLFLFVKWIKFIAFSSADLGRKSSQLFLFLGM